jgi:hypothetical protein
MLTLSSLPAGGLSNTRSVGLAAMFVRTAALRQTPPVNFRGSVER